MTDHSAWRRPMAGLLLAPAGALGVLLLAGLASDLRAGVSAGAALAHVARATAPFAVIGFPVAYLVEGLLVVVTGRVTPGDADRRAVVGAGAAAGALALPIFGLAWSGWSSLAALGLAALVGAAMGSASGAVYLAVLRGGRSAKRAA